MNTCLSRRRFMTTGSAIAALSGLSLSPAAALAAAIGGSRLDPTDMQVLFADLQASTVAQSATTPAFSLSRAAGALAKVASIVQMPSTFSVVAENDAPPVLIPELRPFATAENTIQRTPVNPFHDRRTVEALARSGRKTLVIAGFAMEIVVAQSVLDAIEEGYTVFHVVDASGGLSRGGEDAALEMMARAGSTPTSVVGLVTRLVNDFEGPTGKQVWAAVQLLSMR
ncbi:isochorismatase family protein [Paraburkholderia sp. EG286B]|uniref:isochorismatase family protein n=1 Tax=Paraburkholderia sp. EG286B TaxID=3237011 RepID=UPI0034D34EDC